MTQPTAFLSIAIAALAAIVWHSAPGGAPPHDLAIVTRDFAFDAPDSIPAGVTTIRLENHGPGPHHVALVRLDAGHTAEDVEAALAHEGPWPAWLTFLGGPQAPTAGMATTATVDLAAGHYLITCLVHSLDSVSHAMVSHVARGMVRPLTVTGAYRPAPLPRADMTITLVDYGFDVSRPLVAGRQVIRVRNTAAQPHELVLVRLAPGNSIGDLTTWIRQPNAPPPAVPVAGLTPIAPGVEANITVDLAPGEYGLICVIPDATDGAPHFAHGMMRQFTVGGLIAHRLP
jgi:hypothetical protein